MLCAVCMSMFLNEATSGDHHGNGKDFIKASENGCRICRSLAPHILPGFLPRVDETEWQKLEYRFKWERSWRLHWGIEISQGARLIKDQIFVRAEHVADSPHDYDRYVDLVKTDLHLEPSRVRQVYPPLRNIPENTGHEDVACTAKSWLLECKSKHTLCENSDNTREPKWYPKRLIHVGDSVQSPRLVLRDSNGLEGSYVALSHCWGNNPDFLILTSTNIGDFEREIPLHQLPLSFRDAILTCRRLEIPYIWIDSLCILQSGQDSRDDWLFYATEMHKIYLNCDLNIAIDVASNPHEGAFRSRDPDLLQDCYIWTPFHVPEHGRKPIPVSQPSHLVKDFEFLPSRNQTASSSGSQMVLCTVFTVSDFSWPRMKLPLSQRAWVLQEQLMSPRTLHFQADRISWECQQNPTLSEYLPSNLEHEDQRGFDCLYQHEYNITKGRRPRQTRFYECVEQYTGRELSHPHKDKLVAFANIAREFANYFGDDYYAGIFRSTMPRGLLWVSMHWDSLPPTRSAEYRAPSWSWASINGRVMIKADPNEVGYTSLITVEDVEVNLVDPTNRYGQIKSASLTLTGPLISWEALVQNLSKATESGPLKFEDFVALSFGEHDLVLYPDDARKVQHEEDLVRAQFLSPEDIVFIGILETKKTSVNDSFLGCWGLVLLKLNDGKYTRIGGWRADFGFIEKFDQSERGFKQSTVLIV